MMCTEISDEIIEEVSEGKETQEFTFVYSKRQFRWYPLLRVVIGI